MVITLEFLEDQQTNSYFLNGMNSQKRDLLSALKVKKVHRGGELTHLFCGF